MTRDRRLPAGHMLVMLAAIVALLLSAIRGPDLVIGMVVGAAAHENPCEEAHQNDARALAPQIDQAKASTPFPRQLGDDRETVVGGLPVTTFIASATDIVVASRAARVHRIVVPSVRLRSMVFLI